MNHLKTLGLIGILLSCACAHAELESRKPHPHLLLAEGWNVQSSAKVRESGEILSTQSFSTKDWLPANVPSTLVGVLYENKQFEDPYYGMNLRKVPGTTYEIGKDFSLLPMPADSPFIPSWWYRTEFKLPKHEKDHRTYLHFGGINYSANIWLNGKKLASNTDVAGTFRTYDFDITDVAKAEQYNALAIEIFAPQPDNLAGTWVDWNPVPGDKNMGIWREVSLSDTGPVALRFPQVISKVNMPMLNRAALSVSAELLNGSNMPVTGVLHGEIGEVHFNKSVTLPAHQETRVSFEPKQFPQLSISEPRLWWPANLGPQNLYPLKMTFEIGGQVSDQKSIRFGIREVTSEITPEGSRLFKINGQRILIRGGGWAPDLLLRSSNEREEQEMRYVRDLGLNTIRLEGKMETEHFFDLADEYGILLMPGWACCSHWEDGEKWKDRDFPIAAASLKDQIRRHRHHASLLAWLYGSDIAPPAKIENLYLGVLNEQHWPNPSLSAASAKGSNGENTGVKMTGPYEYVPPSYWYIDRKNGGAYGFNTETSMGPAVPPIESLKKMIPADHLWPVDSVWNFHAGQDHFQNINIFTKALNRRYGEAHSVEEFALKSQVLAYDGHRAMFEAYAKNKYASATGVVQWMLNNAWPSLIWHLYDYYLAPGGAYFGAKKANELLHVQYSYDDRSVVVVNSLYRSIEKVKVIAKVLNFDLTEKFAQETTVDISPDSSNRVIEIPEIKDLTTTYFVKLELQDQGGKTLSNNFYWLSTQKEVMDWDNTDFTMTPTLVDADMTLLNKLPKASVKTQLHVRRLHGEGKTQIMLENTGKTLAFAIRLKLTAGKEGDEVLPILWKDNYISLLPGEKRQIDAEYDVKDLKGQKPALEISGWNLSNEEVALD